ncbi:hypothetical protein AAHE18_01G037100 [Arachis hypogaea]|uniref:Uncharacterized protein n=1 Tax=Arachis hypogaea TaxID=3818 RepID=A0A445EVY5_ARAHY|nr:uncharacterized protein DS421_1g04520 [Arachis hypogaea]RYR79588.1 hypothetical protein Ahy_A01g004393 [Arachis hypogaea]
MASMVRLCFLVALLLITSELMCFARTTPQGKEYEDQDPDHRDDFIPLALEDPEKTQVISEDDYKEPGANPKHTPPPPPPL